MPRSSVALLFGLTCVLGARPGWTQGIHAVRPLPGYVCMLLTPEDEVAKEQSQLPPIFAKPSSNSQKLGFPSGTIFVKSPMHSVNGFAEMLRVNGEVGWIDVQHLRPWHPASKNGDTCVPSVMSNGRLGIG